MRRYAGQGRNGNVILEFAAVGPLMVIILLGVVGVGFTLSRSIQVTQVTRDAGKLFFDGVDLATPGNQRLVGRLGNGMGLANDATGTIDTTGNGVVILSQIIKVGGNECAAGGYPSVGTCPNYNQLVIQKRIVIGNASLRASSFGSPQQSLITADGSILPSDFVRDASVLVPLTATPQILNLATGQFTYGSESYFRMPPLLNFLANDSYAFLLL